MTCSSIDTSVIDNVMYFLLTHLLECSTRNNIMIFDIFNRRFKNMSNIDDISHWMSFVFTQIQYLLTSSWWSFMYLHDSIKLLQFKNPSCCYDDDHVFQTVRILFVGGDYIIKIKPWMTVWISKWQIDGDVKRLHTILHLNIIKFICHSRLNHVKI